MKLLSFRFANYVINMYFESFLSKTIMYMLCDMYKREDGHRYLSRQHKFDDKENQKPASVKIRVLTLYW